MIRVELDRGLCSGHARCNAAAAALFALDDLGYVHLPDGYVATNQEDLAARGVAACPERALKISQLEARLTTAAEQLAEARADKDRLRDERDQAHADGREARTHADRLTDQRAVGAGEQPTGSRPRTSRASGTSRAKEK